MTDRPTPEQIADALHGIIPDDVPELVWLRAHLLDGAVIVHPDDHLRRLPHKADTYSLTSYNDGRGDLHREIFGDPDR